MNTSATPLMSLDAVALDTETTGLDARTAKIVEIAVLQMRGLEISYQRTLELFINPNCAIPGAASEIHGITAKDLRGAPEFKHIVDALENRIGDAVVVGHNIGYDLAIIAREYARAGLTWNIPRSLDVRALARLADPHLASYELRTLCDWLGVEIYRRHRAFPDALAAAQVFIELVPRLRECGIRTLAEAELASRNLPGEERLYQIGGWISPAEAASANTAPIIASIDSYPYRHRVRDALHHRAVFLDPSASLKIASEMVTAPSAGGLVIVRNGERLTFLTAEDLLKASFDENVDKLEDLKCRTLPTVGEDEFLYRAIGKMCRLEAPYLGVVNRTSDVVGTISSADLLRHRATSALILGDEIEAARNLPDLGRAWAKLSRVVAASLGEGLDSSDIAAIISAEIRVLTARATDFAEERMLADGKGRPPCAYAVLVLGSAGRGDSLLSADQDNAIVYRTGEPNGEEDEWFAELGGHIADILHDVGIPYCEGGVMAKNAGCRHSFRIWKKVVDDWVDWAGPKEVLASDIFFDGVPVAGDLILANDLMTYSFAQAERSEKFIAALAEFAKNWHPPIGLLGRLSVERDGRIDLKKNGMLPIVTAARTLALKNGIRLTSTVARLGELGARGSIDSSLAKRATRAFSVLAREILNQQVNDSDRGIRPSARVDVNIMGTEKKQEIITAMRVINELIGATLNL